MNKTDILISGPLLVTIYAIQPEGKPLKSATVAGLQAARDWLNADGGYAKMKANFRDGQIASWSVYRQDCLGYYCAAHIGPAA